VRKTLGPLALACLLAPRIAAAQVVVPLYDWQFERSRSYRATAAEQRATERAIRAQRLQSLKPRTSQIGTHAIFYMVDESGGVLSQVTEPRSWVINHPSLQEQDFLNIFQVDRLGAAGAFIKEWADWPNDWATSGELGQRLDWSITANDNNHLPDPPCNNTLTGICDPQIPIYFVTGCPDDVLGYHVLGSSPEVAVCVDVLGIGEGAIEQIMQIITHETQETIGNPTGADRTFDPLSFVDQEIYMEACDPVQADSTLYTGPLSHEPVMLEDFIYPLAWTGQDAAKGGAGDQKDYINVLRLQGPFGMDGCVTTTNGQEIC